MGLYEKDAKEIYKFLIATYPWLSRLPSSKSIRGLNDIMTLQLSHLGIRLFMYTLFVDLSHVSHVKVQSKWMNVKQYALLTTPYMYCIRFPYMFKNPMLFPKALLPELAIEEVSIDGTDQPVKYTKWAFPTYPTSPYKNHFTIRNFMIDENAEQLSTEINRLLQVRDKYSTLHFHLENNTGGDLIPVHTIMRYLCGKQKEPWMKDYFSLDSLYGSYSGDPWSPWESTSYDNKLYKQLNIVDTPLFDKKYSGNIVLHVNELCGSSTWFFMTYMVYAFASYAERKTMYLHGVPIRIGTPKGGTLKINGYSSATSGDGNSIEMPALPDFPYRVDIPTQQFIKGAVRMYDYGRFWMPTA